MMTIVSVRSGLILNLVHVGLAALFLLAAGVQFNDPDPLYWVLVYGLAGVAALGMALGRTSPVALAMLIGAALGGIAQSLPGVAAYVASGDFGSIVGDMTPGRPWVEETREGFGLMILVVVLGCYLRMGRNATISAA
jgi:hypothetical protein